MRQHSGKKRLGAVLLSLALCLSLLPGTALAADDVPYIGANGESLTQSNVTEVTTDTTIWSNSWYVAQGEVEISSRITVTGDVHLILADGCTLTVNGGIRVGSSQSLTIYGQSEGENAGTLVANGSETNAGIGGGQNIPVGTVTIYGGTVEATGGPQDGAGIGIGSKTETEPNGMQRPVYKGTLTVYGGTVTAQGGGRSAGIGGGHSEGSGTVNIYGGTVTAIGAEGAAGIGSANEVPLGATGNVTITGGTVEATGGEGGAGIGGSTATGIDITGGTVTANGGVSGRVNISGGTVTVNGGISGNFSTGTNGHAVIFAGGIPGWDTPPDPWDQPKSGVFFQNGIGKVYSNNGANVTPTEDFTIEEGMTLTIGNENYLNQDDGILTIGPDVTLTNKGTIINNKENGITNEGTIINYGTITNNKKNGITNTGTIINNNTITNKGTITNNDTGTIANDGTITNDGTINNAGTIDIYEDGKLDGNEVSGTGTVNHKVTRVSLDKTSLTLTVGDEETLTATVTPDKATNKDVTWTSSDPSVATVADGVVTAVGAGTATITATAADGSGKTAACTVTVERPYVPPANPNYRIDVTTTEGGTVAKDPAAAKAGETVTLTPTPEEGYEVGEVTVTDRFGDTVEVTENPDGTYTFTMPNGQVRVSVTFVEVQPEPLPFTDVKESDWFHDAVRYVYDNGLMDGVGDGQFAPNATTTRAQLVTILYRLAGEPDVSGDVGFADVETGLWYSNAVTWAAEKGIVNGISETEFAPAGDLTREQLATILYRYAEAEGYDVSAAADLSGYPDAGKVQTYAQEAMSWAVAEGIVEGMDGNLNPAGNATRAQIATILMRFCEGVAQ